MWYKHMSFQPEKSYNKKKTIYEIVRYYGTKYE